MKPTVQDWVEVFCLGAIGGGAWLAWGFGIGLVIVGAIGLLVSLRARLGTK